MEKLVLEVLLALIKAFESSPNIDSLKAFVESHLSDAAKAAEATIDAPADPTPPAA